MTEQQIQIRAKELQKDCSYTVQQLLVLDKDVQMNITNQGATNVWMFRKLAEIELKIEENDKSRISK